MTSSEVEKAEQAQVPALVTTPALEIGPQDIAFPRLYIAQYMTKAVKDGLVKAGSLFTAVGDDDPDAAVISDGDDPVVLHVIAMKRGKSAQIDGELETYAYDDPDAPASAYTTYNYVVALPQVDTDLPYKFLLKRTGTSAAKKINLALQQYVTQGPPWDVAFELRTDFRKNTQGDFWVPVVSSVEAKPEDVKVAAALSAFVPAEPQGTSDGAQQPSI